MNPFPSSPTSQPLHHYRRENKYTTKTMFLLWLLGFTTLFSLFILFAPTPFNLTSVTKQETKIIAEPRRDYETCDLFDGRWIPDIDGPLYTNRSCSTIPVSKNCGMHGRRDVDYMSWRWKPYGCELQRFDAKRFLGIVRGKTMAFVGDSVARNQMESLLCLLSQDQTPRDLYKDSKDRFRTWYFPSHNFTMKVLWTKFLVAAEARLNNGSTTGAYDLYLDKIDEKWARDLHNFDYIILSDEHWFFRELYLHYHGNIIGCIYCDSKKNNVTNLNLSIALQKVFRSALKYINNCEECGSMVTILRTFSPAHFEHGSWNTGGRCNKTYPYNENQIDLRDIAWEYKTYQAKEVERVKKIGENKGKRFKVLDVTKAMLMRPDGHPDLHWDNQYMKDYSDCVHWCLPGPIDVWNDLLMEILRIEDEKLSLNS